MSPEAIRKALLEVLDADENGHFHTVDLEEKLADKLAAAVTLPGHWEYGIREADDEHGPGDVFASSSSYHWEPFLTIEAARAEFCHMDGTIVRRWVTNAGPWENVPDHNTERSTS